MAIQTKFGDYYMLVSVCSC